MYWLNGIPKGKLSLVGRVFLFGDGFFTTTRLKNGVIELLDWHIERLVLSAQRLMFDCFDLVSLHRELMIAAKYGVNGIIQIVIIRSQSGEGGYSFKKKSIPFRIIYFTSVCKDYTRWYQRGVQLIQSSIRLSRNPLLAGIKHLNRLEQIMIRANFINQGIGDETLVLDTEGNVIECCTANIFWRIGYEVFTPSLIYSGVSGVMRRLILTLLPKLGYHVQEVTTNPECLNEADEVFISNSLLPLVSVNAIERHQYVDRTLCRLLLSYIWKHKLLSNWHLMCLFCGISLF